MGSEKVGSIFVLSMKNDITLVQFKNMSLDEKLKLVLTKGVYVQKSRFKNCVIELYRMGKDFLEMWKDSEGDHVTKIEIISKQPINKFLKHVNFTTLN